MTSGIYAKGRQRFLRAEIAWHTDDIKAVLVDTDDYAVNLATDEFLSDIPSIARAGTSNSFVYKTTTAGWAGTPNIIFTGVPLNDPCEAIVIYKNAGADSVCPLIAYLDSSVILNLPIVPNGAKITVLFEAGAPGLFQI